MFMILEHSQWHQVIKDLMHLMHNLFKVIAFNAFIANSIMTKRFLQKLGVCQVFYKKLLQNLMLQCKKAFAKAL